MRRFLIVAMRVVIALAAAIVAAILTNAAFNAWVPLPSLDQVDGEAKRQFAFALYYIVQVGAALAAARLAWRWL
jgi:hypothetical protein